MSLWISSSLLLLWRFATPEFGEFDPQGRLPLLSQQSTLLYQQTDAPSDRESTLLLISDRTCSCTAAATLHLQQLHAATALPIHQQELSDLSASIRKLIPATPLLLWWQQGVLQYAGPPAAGPWCSIENDVLIPLLQQKQRLPGQWLHSTAQSCRCLQD